MDNKELRNRVEKHIILSDEKFKKLMDAYDDLLKALDKQANEFRKKGLVK